METGRAGLVTLRSKRSSDGCSGVYNGPRLLTRRAGYRVVVSVDKFTVSPNLEAMPDRRMPVECPPAIAALSLP